MSITLLQKDSFNFHKKASYNKFPIDLRLGIDCVLDVVNQKLERYEELKHHLLFIKGRTGSGKSTCIPTSIFKEIEGKKSKYLVSDKKYKAKTVVNVIEPRVILAQSIVQDNCTFDKYFVYGYNIGYKTGNGKTLISSPSKLVYMTTEIFRMMISNGDDLGNVVIVDECHQLDTPMIILLSEIKEYIYTFKDLHKMPLFIFTSATIGINNMIEYYFKDSRYDLLSDIFSDALMINYISGSRNFPVEETFLTEEFKNDTEFIDWVLTDGIETSLKSKYTVIDKTTNNKVVARDILIFAASANFVKKFDKHKQINYPIYKSTLLFDDSDKVKKWREENKNKTRILILPYSRISKGFSSYLMSDTMDHDEESQKNEIKIFITTPVLETGKTFDTWYQVYDLGLTYEKILNPLLYNVKYNNVELVPINKSSSIQRCGRVGRKTNGIAHRVYKEELYNLFETDSLPQNINIPSNISMVISCKKNNDNFSDPIKYNDFLFQNSFDTNLITGCDLVLSGYTTPWGEYINDVRNELIDQKWVLEAEYLYYTENKSLEEVLVLCRNSRQNMSLIFHDYDFNKIYFNPKDYNIKEPNKDRIEVISSVRKEYVNFLVGINETFLKIK